LEFDVPGDPVAATESVVGPVRLRSRPVNSDNLAVLQHGFELALTAILKGGGIMSELTDLPNIGPRLARALTAAGIDTPRALYELGSVAAWWRIHPAFDCLHSLLSLEAAIQNIPKSQLDDATRLRLKGEAARSAQEAHSSR